ncbi:LexA family transcriptional regulator [Campylobacter hyointestinalis]|uniref:LexA family transcriptional regulator n=1 Tax=Campylobacter hyointestinalis TaxID=198 RepID=UPI0011AC75BB|nr:LexA family transcriptional regulator [Campylobacter hyointestinalis]TWO18736.1 S24 family peptidase [Campylobacter hyointestinalis]
MRKIDPILNKLRELTDSDTDKEMCKILNINYATLDTWKTLDSIPSKRLIEFAERFDISLDTLKNNVSKNNTSSKYKQMHTEQDGYWISKISHNASAGTLADIEGIEVYDTDEKIFLPSTFFKTIMKEKFLRMVPVEGDSMYPVLKSGDWVVIGLTKEFTGDAMYVINYQNILMVKSLQMKPNGNLYIKSINSSYDSYEISPESQNVFNIVGKVIKTIS